MPGYKIVSQNLLEMCQFQLHHLLELFDSWRTCLSCITSSPCYSFLYQTNIMAAILLHMTQKDLYIQTYIHSCIILWSLSINIYKSYHIHIISVHKKSINIGYLYAPKTVFFTRKRGAGCGTWSLTRSSPRGWATSARRRSSSPSFEVPLRISKIVKNMALVFDMFFFHNFVTWFTWLTWFEQPL